MISKAVGGKGISVICFWRTDGKKSVSFGDFGRFFWGEEKIQRLLGNFGNLFLEGGVRKNPVGLWEFFWGGGEICTRGYIWAVVRLLITGFPFRDGLAGGGGEIFRLSGSGGVFCGFSAQGGFWRERRQPAIAIVAESRISTGQGGGRSVASPAGLDSRGACEGLERKARARGAVSQVLADRAMPGHRPGCFVLQIMVGGCSIHWGDCQGFILHGNVASLPA